MPFFAEDENDDYDDGGRALRTKDAMRESTRNVIEALHNDIGQQKMFVQTVDEETGFPTSRTLVSGGIEVFNDQDFGLPDASEYNIDAILSGDVTIEDAVARLEGTDASAKPSSVPVSPVAPPAAAVQTVPDTESVFRLLGLPFLKREPSMPDKQVRISFTGTATFQVPFVCQACEGRQNSQAVPEHAGKPVDGD